MMQKQSSYLQAITNKLSLLFSKLHQFVILQALQQNPLKCFSFCGEHIGLVCSRIDVGNHIFCIV